MLDRFHRLADGVKVRLRLPHVGDRRGLEDLLERLGLAADELDARWAPGRRWAVMATSWDGGSERVVGFAAVDLPVGAQTLIAESEHVLELLGRALDAHASAKDRRVA